MAAKLRNYGSLFIGPLASVVYSDKCAGTNHTLPTMAAGRYTGGLWVTDTAFDGLFGPQARAVLTGSAARAIPLRR